MRTAHAFLVGGAATAILTAGWAASPKSEATPTYADASVDTTPGSTDTGVATSSAPADDGSGTRDTASAEAPTDGGTYTGAAVQTRYGVYQVRLTVSAGEVTDVALVQDGATDRESQQIKSYALPQLMQEVLTTQSADVSYISGASYTSDGFLGSVADAFQQAGLG